MDLIFDDDHHGVIIHWGRPTELGAIKQPEGENDLLYLITTVAPDGSERMIYIGQAYSQSVATRINQPDHREKRSAWSKRFLDHSFRIRLGEVTFKNGRASVAKVNALEAILIYCFDSDDCLNEKSKYGSKISGRYEISNTGSKAGLPKRIGYGFYCRY